MNSNSNASVDQDIFGNMDSFRLNIPNRSGEDSSVSSSKTYVWDTISEDYETPLVEISRKNFVPPQPPTISRKQDNSSVVKILASEDDEDDITLCSRISTLNTFENSIQSAVDDLKSKVDSMKEAIDIKTKTIRELQSELLRLTSARNRKYERCTQNVEANLKTLKEENSEIKGKKIGFKNRLAAEVKSFSDKLEALSQKRSLIEEGKAKNIEMAMLESDKKLQRAKKQWMNDEKITMEKSVNSKVESMKKQAAESIAPMLDNLVLENKSELRNYVLSLETKLENQKLELESDLKEKVLKTLQTEKRESQENVQRKKLAMKSKLEDLKNRFLEETNHFAGNSQREKNLLSEQNHRQRMLESESINESLKNTRIMASKRVQEVESAMIAELNRVVQQNQVEIEGILAKEIEELALLEGSMKEEREKKEQLRKRQMEEDLLQRTEAETHRLLVKVREDVLQERNQIQNELEKNIQQYRQECQERLNSSIAAEQRSSDRHRALNADIILLKDQRKSLEDVNYDRKKRLQDLENTMKELRWQLRQSEQMGVQGESSRQEIETSKRNELEEDLKRWKITESEAQKKWNELEASIFASREKAKQDNANEILRIRDKIQRIFAIKDAAVRELNGQLTDLNHQVEEKQKVLEQYREERLPASFSGGALDNAEDQSRDTSRSGSRSQINRNSYRK